MLVMAEPLTPREKEVLAIIRGTVRSRGYPPSLREIGQQMGFRSSSSVHEYVRRLEEKGYLRRDVAKPRAIEVLDPPGNRPPPETVDLPVFVPLDPSKPLWTEENRRGTFVLPRDFLGEGTFFGLALSDKCPPVEGFASGDMVILRQEAPAREGDVLLAAEGGSLRLIRHHGEAPSREYPWAGKVVALVRRIG